MPLDERMKLLEELKNRTSTHACPSCGEPVYCAMEDGKSANTCWCMNLTRTEKIDCDAEYCKCKSCLKREDSE